ncbi:prephenate dehydratase [Fulvimarina sp. 2208YS6-2-32]|uniref:prephenate dehydratase n=1 Tax=Fulvimarina uroteuthidis TaxID=3098149 RepID=A0ABU5I4Z5_9HYPH|nr:prephenate dehydratase [Fulvimarina sp. 2208YS6-2-32]MDY8109869.1 prephenate dehydratase [Fulvimarina sp. 2208YS6-2-32]
MSAAKPIIAFQGERGANSDMACATVYGDTMTPLACPSFDDAFAAVKSGEAARAMIPIENTLAGRVADIHHLMPESGLRIVGEHYMPIHFQLMVLPGVQRAEITAVKSHIHALGQCRKYLRANGWKPLTAGDTAGAAREVRDLQDRTHAALAPELAAGYYGLEILERNVEDSADNVTRFVILELPDADGDARAGWADRSRPCVTTFVFQVRNIPAALYKALGGFATNGVNMTKLESYQIGGKFVATQFYADVEGHPDDDNLRLALEELDFFTENIEILGVYEASPDRKSL